MILAALSGLDLYQTKHRSQLLDQQITGILNSADANRERMRVLRAEYQLLQDPSRMGDLASQHLTLAKTEPKQFVNWATLERMIPVVIAPATPATDPTPVAEPETPVAGLMGPPAPQPPQAGSPAPQQIAVAHAETPPPRAVSPPAASILTQQVARVAPAPVAPSAPPRAPTPSTPAQTGLTASAAPLPRSALGMARAEAGWANAAAPRSVVATPQPVLAAQRRAPYQAPRIGDTEAIARLTRAAVSGPAAAPVASALGMARTLSSSSYFSPASAAGWIPNGGG